MIGLHGKKYLVLSKGDSRAIPDPPLVKASRIPWLAPTANKNDVSFHQLFEKRGVRL